MEDAALPLTEEKRRGRGPRSAHERRLAGRLDPSISPYEYRKRRPDPYDPATLERQIRCYDLRVRGFTNVQIAAAVGIDRSTVATDLLMETQRRIEERAAARPELIEMQTTRFENVVARVGARQAAAAAMAQAETEKPGGGNWRREIALRQLIAADEKHIVAAIDKLADMQGLKAPIKLEVDHNDARSQALLDTIAAMSSEQRVALYDIGHDERETRLRNVTP